MSASAASPTPAATTSDAPQLPLIPSSLNASDAACTEGSKTQVAAVSWAQQSLGLAAANRYSQGKGVQVAVVDTGVAPGAAGLSGRVRAQGAAAEDCVGHGTFLAGVIGAAAVPGSGFAGVAPQARIIAERGTDQWGVPSAALTAQGIEASVDAGVDVVLVSAALPQDAPALRTAVEHAADKDVLVVAPAAPDTAPADTSAQSAQPPADYWPAATDGVLSVVSVDIAGDRPEDVPQPLDADLAAPGEAITGIGPAGRGNYVANGSSVAAAFVAGAAALVRAHQPDLTAAQTAARLRATAAHASVPLLDPTAALSTVLSSPAPSPAPDEGAVHLPEAAPRSAVVPRAWTLAGVSLLLVLAAGGAMALARVRTSRRQAGGARPESP
ncbi:S8 family serine peptidase [Streptomyces sp. CRN 30]|uniref:S8 family serine peptidase n=1 Tax=Streptomyces sp. CRN 30 TaxID=3075613 RepID=UPI002A7EF46C|nr:S8 family serine peptidase [Streptomyces sp. CRN 30]